MYTAKFTANNPSPILPSRPISAPTEFRISLATPLESALARNAIHHFVTPIESAPFFQISPLRAKFASVTPVSTTLTEHAPYNPIRMNTSGKTHVAIPLPPNATNSYKTTYTKSSPAQVNHSTHNPPPQFAHSFSISLTSRPARSISPGVFNAASPVPAATVDRTIDRNSRPVTERAARPQNCAPNNAPGANRRRLSAESPPQ
jgi:hypothetical protein